MTRSNGEGTIYRRKDGRYEAAVYLTTVSGQRKRVRFYAKTREQVRIKLTEAVAHQHRGLAVPDRSWSVGDYLDYWLQNVAKPKVRPRTFGLYESVVRIHLKPILGSVRLLKLSVPQLQMFFNQRLEGGATPRTIHLMRTVLSAALGRAMREELLGRNVARLVELPAWRRREVQPWSSEEIRRFLAVAEGHKYYAAFVLLAVYGLRRGEVLGLRWSDIDRARGEVHIRQQVQRYNGALQVGPVKTDAGRRDLPLLPAVATLLEERHPMGVANRLEALVFVSSTGNPVEPGNLLRSFHTLTEAANLPRITLHYLRHSAATILKDLGVPARDAQVILGHAQVSTTQAIYQHGTTSSQKQALAGLEQALLPTSGSWRCRQTQPSNTKKPPFREGTAAWDNRYKTIGGSSGARTHDTLLKSLMWATDEPPTTEAAALVASRAQQQLLGAVAVKRSRQEADESAAPDLHITALADLVRAARALSVTNPLDTAA